MVMCTWSVGIQIMLMEFMRAGSFNSILTRNVPFYQEAKSSSVDKCECVWFFLVYVCNHGGLSGSIDIQKPFHFSTITTGNYTTLLFESKRFSFEIIVVQSSARQG